MSFTWIVVLLVLIALYWAVTQILPERRKTSLLRHGLAVGLLANLNEHRYQRGLPPLEIDDELAMVAENKAIHQVMTGKSSDGWEYPDRYQNMMGRSLLMEALLSGPLDSMNSRLLRQRELFDPEWAGCGLGVAAGKPGELAVAIVLCRQAWETRPEEAQFLTEEHVFLTE